MPDRAPFADAPPDQVGPIDIPDLQLAKEAGADPVARFLGLLRTNHGLVFVVRQQQSLQPLQDAAQQAAASNGPACLSLRYRLQSGAEFGTLLTALVNDLDAMRNGSPHLLGIPAPEAGRPEWMSLVKSPLDTFLERRQTAPRGRLGARDLNELLRLLGNDQVLQWGVRLVVFAEVVGADADPQAAEQWNRAVSGFWGELPPRVGLVLSGAPLGFAPEVVPVSYAAVDSLPAGPAQATAAGEVMYRSSGLVADRATSADHLGRAKLAKSTAEFLLHPNTAPPFTIGLFGAWGKGKSSFIEQLDLQLRERAVEEMRATFPTLPPGSMFIRAYQQAWVWWRVGWERSRLQALEAAAAKRPLRPGRIDRAKARLAEWRIVTVTFNAWQFEDAKQTWAGLASVISERIEEALPWWRRLWLRVLYAWRNYRGELILNVGLPLALMVLGAAIIAISPGLREALGGLVESKTTDGPVVKLARSILPGVSALILALLGWWRLAEGVKPLSERLMAYAQRPDYRGEMGYQHQVIEDLRFLLRQLQRARPGCRVLVHVDDLDRCSDEKVVELLRATNLVLAACDLFVLLAVDDGMLRKAIETQKKGDPDNYLRKIVQISLFLPSTQADARLEMVSQFFSDATRAAWLQGGAGAAKEEAEKQGDGDAGAGTDGLAYDLATVLPAQYVEVVADTREELAAMHDCREYLPDNARELKRLVNTHRFVKILLSGGGAWSDERQRALVKWLVFCANWPDLVDDVLAFAAASPTPDDCLAQVQHAYGGDERLAKFIAIAPPLAPDDLRGDFAVAARLSQVVYDSVPAAPAQPAAPPPAA